MPKTTQKPCRQCHRWFRPDVRVGERQHTCGRKECQTKRRQKNQSLWRARHPDYFSGQRLQIRKGMTPSPEPLRLPPPLTKLPWDIARQEISASGADFIGMMGALLLRTMQEPYKREAVDIPTDPGQHARSSAKD